MESRANKRTQRLPKTSRIHLAADFVRLKRHGKRRDGALIRLYCLRRDSAANGGKRPKDRLAVVTRRSVGKAHERNLWRRRLRDLFRREVFGDRAGGWDYLVVVKASGESASTAQLRIELRRLLTGV